MELVFATGSTIKKVFIKGRVITFILAEFNFQPLTINLDKLDESEEVKKIDDDGLIKELSKLKNESQIAHDVIKDFQKDGWRLIKWVH